MKNKIRTTVIACLFFAFSSMLCACSQKTTAPELQSGEITYNAATCEVIVNKENSGTVALASASNGATVTYSLSEEEQTKFDNKFKHAISIGSDGAITGTATKVEKLKVSVTASAQKCEPVTSVMTISVVNPYLDYSGKALTDAVVGLPYASSVALVKDEDITPTYAFKSGTLPEGLSFAADGTTIVGTPTKVGAGKPFKVTARAEKFSDTAAEFTIDVVLNHESTTQSKIINFGKEGETTALNDAYVGVSYVNQAGVAGSAAALNSNVIKYSTTATLPDGITLYPNGAIIGKCDTKQAVTFDVTAKAAGCPTLTRSFSLAVKPQKIQYAPISGVLTKGEEANFDIATASAEGEAITYSMTEAAKTKLKSEYDLDVTADGKITGKPKVSVEKMYIEVSATAEGYSPRTVTHSFRINEPLQTVANNKFEAELTYLGGKMGTGYSGAPTGSGLIDTNAGTSDGKFVSYLHNGTVTLEFVIKADAAAENVPIYFALGSEMGNATFTSSSLGVYHYAEKDTTGKKTEVEYGSVTVKGGDNYTTFDEYKFGTVNLVKGWNVIQLAVHDNSLRKGVTGGPGVDYLRIDTSVKLQWQPCPFQMK